MARSNGAYGQAPNWRHQSHVDKDQFGDERLQRHWQQVSRSQDRDLKLKTNSRVLGGSSAPAQNYSDYPAQPGPPADPHLGAVRLSNMQGHSPYEVSTAQSTWDDPMADLDFIESYDPPELRPTAHDHQLRGMKHAAKQLAQQNRTTRDLAAYGFGNHNPVGTTQSDRPGFSEEGNVPTANRNFGTPSYGRPQSDQVQPFDQGAFPPEFVGHEHRAVERRVNAYAEDNDEEYDDEGRNPSCKLLIAVALVGGIVVGGGLVLAIVAAASGTDWVGPRKALDRLANSTILAPTTVTHEAMMGLPRGFECPVVPNGFNPLASIYRRDENGIHWQVKDLSQDANIVGKKRTFRIADYTLSDEQIGSSKLSGTLVRSALPGLSASASANTNSTKAIGVTVKDLTGEVINDQAEDYIVEWFRKNIKPRAGNRYFIVREAIKAGSVSYTLKDSDVAKLGGAAEIKNIANGKADVTVRNNQGRLEIEQKFESRISVCTKPSEITSL